MGTGNLVDLAPSHPPLRGTLSLAGRGIGLKFIVFFAVLAGCKGPATEKSQSSTTASSNVNVSLNKDDYPVFPVADAGADPSVPAEQGGKGFKGAGWETNTGFDLIGDPRAVKGGLFREYAPLAPG